ncbi:branched-chain amino acid ABC transporter permease [Brevibacillus sp. B_LB10_24]|uniref:branched-chain amino acid ABC transporter permease n=1 Tax=Brevibacillus sp. B_LB10_24 TaxID=3380645 RepID=UPI0038B8DC6D
MGVLVEQLLNGLIIGSMYSLVASGLSLIWGTMKMLNFAHGEFYMVGGYLMYFTNVASGMNPLLACSLSLIAVFLLGVLIERMIIHHLLDRPGWDISPLIATIGISIFMQNFALRVWGERFKNIPYYVEGNASIAGVEMSYQRMLIFVVAIVVVVLFWAFLKFSRYGMAMRATSQNRDAAAIYGVNIYGIYMITFGISAMLATLAAVMLSPIYSVNPWMGIPPLLKAFTVVVLGGLGSLEGAIIGGVILGILESLGVFFFSSEWRDVVAFTVLILVLWVRPTGLFGAKVW